MIKPIKQVKITKIKCQKALKDRLLSYGITEGAIVKVEKNLNGVIISHLGKLLAIGKELCNLIEVEICA